MDHFKHIYTRRATEYHQNPKQLQAAYWPQVVTPALTLTFGMQSIRALLPYLQYILGDRFGWSAIQLGLVGLVLFSSGFLAARLTAWLGLRPMLLVSAGGLGIVRLATQLWAGDPVGDMLLVMLATIFFVLFLPVHLALVQGQSQPVEASRRFALAILLGLAIDTALHGLFLTYDYIWQAGALALILTAGLVLVQWAALVRLQATVPSSPVLFRGSLVATLPWLAIGPFLFLQLLVFQNQARLAALTDWSLPTVFATILISHVAGLGMATLWSPGKAGAAVSGLALVVTSWPPAGGPLVFAPALLVGQTAAAILVTTIVQGLVASSLNRPRSRPGYQNIGLSHGFSMILLVGLIFAFYIPFQLRAPYQKDWVVILAGLVIGGGGLKAAGGFANPIQNKPFGLAWAVPLSLLVFPLFVFFTWHPPTPGDIRPGPLRVMTYNLHNGFNAGGQLGLEELARVIEAEQPDLVTLQEVSRGWIVNGSVDMFGWLAQRLNLPYVHFAPASDALWGQAIISRYPILLAEDRPLPPQDLPLNRSFTYVQLDIGQNEPLHLVNTHFHQVRAESAIRVIQAKTILEFLGDRALNQFIMTGDLNAEPDRPEIQLLYQHGLHDVVIGAGLTPGYTFTSIQPFQRLDYILVSPDLAATNTIIPGLTASDHLPIATTITRN